MGGRSSKKNAKAVVPYDPDEPLSQEELEDPKAYEQRIKKSRYASLQEFSASRYRIPCHAVRAHADGADVLALRH